MEYSHILRWMKAIIQLTTNSSFISNIRNSYIMRWIERTTQLAVGLTFISAILTSLSINGLRNLRISAKKKQTPMELDTFLVDEIRETADAKIIFSITSSALLIFFATGIAEQVNFEMMPSYLKKLASIQAVVMVTMEILMIIRELHKLADNMYAMYSGKVNYNFNTIKYSILPIISSITNIVSSLLFSDILSNSILPQEIRHIICTFSLLMSALNVTLSGVYNIISRSLIPQERMKMHNNSSDGTTRYSKIIIKNAEEKEGDITNHDTKEAIEKLDDAKKVKPETTQVILEDNTNAADKMSKSLSKTDTNQMQKPGDIVDNGDNTPLNITNEDAVSADTENDKVNSAGKLDDVLKTIEIKQSTKKLSSNDPHSQSQDDKSDIGTGVIFDSSNLKLSRFNQNDSAIENHDTQKATEKLDDAEKVKPETTPVILADNTNAADKMSKSLSKTDTNQMQKPGDIVDNGDNTRLNIANADAVSADTENDKVNLAGKLDDVLKTIEIKQSTKKLSSNDPHSQSQDDKSDKSDIDADLGLDSAIVDSILKKEDNEKMTKSDIVDETIEMELTSTNIDNLLDRYGTKEGPKLKPDNKKIQLIPEIEEYIATANKVKERVKRHIGKEWQRIEQEKRDLTDDDVEKTITEAQKDDFVEKTISEAQKELQRIEQEKRDLTDDDVEEIIPEAQKEFGTDSEDLTDDDVEKTTPEAQKELQRIEQEKRDLTDGVVEKTITEAQKDDFVEKTISEAQKELQRIEQEKRDLTDDDVEEIIPEAQKEFGTDSEEETAKASKEWQHIEQEKRDLTDGVVEKTTPEAQKGFGTDSEEETAKAGNYYYDNIHDPGDIDQYISRYNKAFGTCQDKVNIIVEKDNNVVKQEMLMELLSKIQNITHPSTTKPSTTKSEENNFHETNAIKSEKDIDESTKKASNNISLELSESVNQSEKSK